MKTSMEKMEMMELNAKELEQVNGGMICIGFGYQNEDEPQACIVQGSSIVIM